MAYEKRALGVFDSGVGGLTVVKEITKLLPWQDIVYFGDTARVPYGTKSKKSVIKFAIQDVKFLLNFDIRMVVAACNTASSFSLPALRGEFDVPIIGVIQPGAKAAVESTKNGKIGVIGTHATVLSGAYDYEMKRVNPDVEIFSKACGLFVPFVEEGWADKKVTGLVVGEYLKELKAKGIDTLILGCTHYPLLKEQIAKIMGKGVKLIDSAEETAKEVKKTLEGLGLLDDPDEKGELRLFVSDLPARFSEVAGSFLGRKIDNVELVDIEEEVKICTN